MSKPVEFDDMIDPAFAEIYWKACSLEKAGEIEDDFDVIEELAQKCKQIAVDYVEMYSEAWGKGGPDFWGGLETYAEKRLKEIYPLSKEFTVLIDANMTYEYKVRAFSREEAEQEAMNMMEQDPAFNKRFREESRVYEMEIGDVIEK